MYYRLDWKVSPPDPELANTGTCNDVGVPWTMGVRYPETVSGPVVCKLHPKRGRKMRDVFLVDVPLFSQKILQCLQDLGIGNLELYDAEIHSPEGEVFAGYKAVNIVGTLACADLSQSEYLPDSEPPMMAFSKLVIDEEKARSMDIFRLAEDTLYILISERVHSALDELDLTGVSMTPMETS
jgi:hypothetical protein